MILLMTNAVHSDTIEHLRGLQVTVKEYFLLVVEGFQWLQNPFMFPLTDIGLLTKQYEELTDISADAGLEDSYTNVTLVNIWTDLIEEFP
jgi:hypothetical protein